MTHDVRALRNVRWRKSSRSNQEGQCIEVAFTVHLVGVRDSKNISGGSLLVSPKAWEMLVVNIKYYDQP